MTVNQSACSHVPQSRLEAFQWEIQHYTLGRFCTAAAGFRGLQYAQQAQSRSQRSHCIASTDAAAHQGHQQTYDNGSKSRQCINDQKLYSIQAQKTNYKTCTKSPYKFSPKMIVEI